MVKGHSQKEWSLFFIAIFWTGIARILIVFFKLKQFSFILGKHMKESAHTNSDADIGIILPIGLAIRRAGRVVPWRCKCYEQAVAAKIILKRKGINSTLYYGVAKSKDEKLKAHAWVRCGTHIVTGKKGMKQFAIVGTFA